MRFSQREGFSPLMKDLQIEGIDSELCSRLWNLLQLYYWDRFRGHLGRGLGVKNSNFEVLINSYWHNFFKKPIDTIPRFFSDAIKQMRDYFFSTKWYNIYDFIEFTLRQDVNFDVRTFPSTCNNILEQENSAYRIVEGKFVPITSEVELKSIEDAISNSAPFIGVNVHLSKALKLLSDRQSPDYRNSIKESISAVESICKTMSGDDKATLGVALAKLEEHMPIHSALKSGFSKIYGYTSDADGIRHALLEESNISFSDAKFMLIACTAFINYLKGKVAELEISIPKNI